MKFTYLSFPSVSSKSAYKQGHPCLPDDFFRMLICGPSNSGKTNLSLNMIYSLLMFDKIYLFSKNLHQYQYRGFLKEFAENINPKVGYEVIEAYDDEIIPLEELPVDNQKIVVFDDLLCKKKPKQHHKLFYQWAAQKLLRYLLLSNLLQGAERHPC